MSHIYIERLCEDHLSDAAALVVEGYRRERHEVPALTERPENQDQIAASLRKWLARAPGVVAFEDDRMSGFLLGLPVPNLRGRHRGTYVAEWSHAASGERRGLVYRYLYETLSKTWVENGCLTHAITLFAHDKEALDAWFWNSFGLLLVDAIRDLSPVNAPIPQGIEIRRATMDDLDQVVRLREAHQRYMAQAPIFMPLLEFDSREERAGFLEDPSNAVFLAMRGGEAVSYIQYQPEGDGTARAVRDPGTVAITGAYTQEDLRSGGIASVLLGHLVDQVRSTGFHRVSVDFESFNIHGSRFWMRHFAPVCYSVIRSVDDRVLWAGKDRARESAW